MFVTFSNLILASYESYCWSFFENCFRAWRFGASLLVSFQTVTYKHSWAMQVSALLRPLRFVSFLRYSENARLPFDCVTAGSFPIHHSYFPSKTASSFLRYDLNPYWTMIERQSFYFGSFGVFDLRLCSEGPASFGTHVSFCLSDLSFWRPTGLWLILFCLFLHQTSHIVDR